MTGLLDAVPTYFQQGAVTRDRKTANLAFGIRLQPLDKQREVVENIKDELKPPPGVDADHLLGLAAAVERHSEHPLAAAVVAESERRELTEPAIDTFETHTGHGVHARTDGTWVGVGREGLFVAHRKAIPPAVQEAAERLRDAGQTALMVVALVGIGWAFSRWATLHTNKKVERLTDAAARGLAVTAGQLRDNLARPVVPESEAHPHGEQTHIQ